MISTVFVLFSRSFLKNTLKSRFDRRLFRHGQPVAVSLYSDENRFGYFLPVFVGQKHRFVLFVG